MTTSFGPRLLPSEGSRFDFHRGLDLPTPIGTPVFAMATGIVKIAGEHNDYSDPLVNIRHFRRGSWGSCLQYGCYHSYYLHLSRWVVSAGDHVRKGQLIGYTGASDSGFRHLHFEIRDAGPDDPLSAWQQDAIHPLQVLPYRGQPSQTKATINHVDVSNPMNPQVELSIFQPASVRTLDVNRIDVEIYDKSTGALVTQPGSVANENGYHLHPPWIDFDQRNAAYTHKDSTSIPWESFADCPFAASHTPRYSPHVHMCQSDPDNDSIGVFNGVRMTPSYFNNTSADYELTIEFTELLGVPDPDDLCVVAYVKSALGAFGEPATWNCER